ncbi:MAG: bacteriohemerythrin [Spirochaetes bacterium]|nr:bacteriohemerythrin [Spirochaetota bacterium]
MEHYDWKDAYNTGIRELDSQHEYLFALTNRLLRQRENPNRAHVKGILDELYEYTEQHFAYEESLMEQSLYDDLLDHKKLHIRLKERLSLYSVEVAKGKLSVDDLCEFMKIWLINHILRQDFHFAEQVKNKKDT